MTKLLSDDLLEILNPFCEIDAPWLRLVVYGAILLGLLLEWLIVRKTESVLPKLAPLAVTLLLFLAMAALAFCVGGLDVGTIFVAGAGVLFFLPMLVGEIVGIPVALLLKHRKQSKT